MDLTARLTHASELTDRLQFDAAESLLRRLGRQTEAQFGSRSAEYALCLRGQGEWHQAVGDLAAAGSLLKQARLICLGTVGADNLASARTGGSLARFLDCYGRHREAREMLENALATYRRALGPKHPDTLRLTADLGRACRHDGDIPQALAHLESAAAAYEKLFGMEHRHTAQTYTDAAACYRVQGWHKQALSVLAQTRAIQSRCSGERHPRTITALIETAAVYDAMKDYRQAKPLYIRAAADCRAVLGSRHPLYAHILNYQAQHYCRQHRFGAAAKLMQQVLPLYLEHFGKQHPYTQEASRNFELFALFGERGGGQRH